jgi:transcriptional regulator of arginine metabolism
VSVSSVLQPAAKAERQRVISDLIRARKVRTQEEIVAALHLRGLEVTQATVSRDIRELGLARVHDPDGLRYVLTGSDDPSPMSTRLRAVMREHVRSVEFVEHLGVVHTRPSSAPLVAAVIDAAHFEEVAGTVAGDDTVLVVVRSRPAARRLAERLRVSVEASVR